MGFSLGGLGDIIDPFQVGYGDVLSDLTGTDAAAEAALTGQREAGAAAERSTEKQLEFLREQKAAQRADVFTLGQQMRTAGAGAAGQRQQLLGAGYDQAISGLQNIDITQDPSYQFRLQQGLGAIEASGAARGMQLSGRTLQGLQDYGQQFASQEYGRAFGRAQTIGQLQAQRGTGMAGQVYDPSQVYSQQMGALTGVGSQYMQQGAGTLQALGQAQSQMYQNIGAIQAQQAVAPFQNLLSLGQTGAGIMAGYGALR